MARFHVIVAEDNSDTRAMVKWLLEQHGYQVDTASDGVVALNLIGRSNPDLILTDLQMPNLSGIELIKRLRQDRKTATTPVVAMSAFGPEELERATAAGANLIIRKPEGILELADKVKSLLPA
ncbi:MAG TPA: response regulator [Blastocatellia bacterium]|nr:response regulator [Blastocatellia bacterium]